MEKDMLRSHGVTVVEHPSDYSAVVAEGRRQAASKGRLKDHLASAGVAVDAEHPLFAYLPCGVGGGPGGVAFGLNLAFGDAVRCIFAEPTHSPCMLLGVLTGLHDEVSVQDFGIDNVTAADGLAVGHPSSFVGRAMQRLIDGYFTVADEDMYALLALLHETEGIGLEPSAVAGLPGAARISASEHAAYRSPAGLSDDMLRNATHLAWATGGSMAPKVEMDAYIEKGRQALKI